MIPPKSKHQRGKKTDQDVIEIIDDDDEQVIAEHDSKRNIVQVAEKRKKAAKAAEMRFQAR